MQLCQIFVKIQMDSKIMNITKEKQVEAVKALDFLRGHPAMSSEASGDSIIDGFWFMMAECCKRGLTSYRGDVGIRIYADSDDAEKYADKFVEEYGEDWRDKEEKFMLDIEIPYEEYYGEPWEFDHVEYWYETTFVVFHGNPYESLAEFNPKNWMRYVGPEGGANSWEDMLIDCAKEVKEEFGDFGEDDFETDAEKANHKDVDAFPLSLTGKTILKRNPEYVWVDGGITNLRWLKWYMETNKAKED